MSVSTHPSFRTVAAASTVAVAALLGACAAPGYDQRPIGSYPAPYSTQPAPYGAQPVQYPAANAPAMVEYGRVANIEIIQTQAPERRSGVAGAVIGGVIGAVVGNQIGSGSGRAAATGLGAVGGAVAGNAIENRNRNNNNVQETYRVSVQIDNGQYRAYDVPSPGDLRVGDRVRVQDGQLQRV